MIPELLKHLETQMTLSLAETRTTFNNSTNKGSALEDVFRKFLREYLPRTKSIGHGEIIDSFGRRGPQVDVAITYDHHPFTFSESSPGIMLIEGVAAIGEVKTSLNTDELERTIAHSKKVKSLQRRFSKDTEFVVPAAFDQRFMFVPPYFLFAYESSISLEKICEVLSRESHTHDAPTSGTKFVDGVFVLNRGFVIDCYPGAGLTAHRADGTPITGWTRFEHDSLRPLLEWLYCTMYDIEYARPYLWDYTGLKRKAN